MGMYHQKDALSRGVLPIGENSEKGVKWILNHAEDSGLLRASETGMTCYSRYVIPVLD